ncbi:isoprenyl transferase [Geomicrobium sediminis]|uniref:Isoprenyl transferase n=1 Tax=Geomicrobium sediminis TaxID=1347788 RepID=A0ABS2PB92_9BACL|nr:isoprenyl transferase [Geomicrobium sediminis]MBM7632621.1 undecaprenyl diphosphate synthase [Geomicrobium sediminis]
MLERFLKKQNESQEAGTFLHVPEHVAIVMDGNGRWATKRGLPRNIGHREGMKRIHEITESADDIGVKILTMFAFSTENWGRPQTEVDFILRLPERFIESELPKLMKNNVQVKMMGSNDGLPQHTINAVQKAVNETANNDGIVLNLALNYGGRADITRAVQKLCLEVDEGKRDANSITEQDITESLFSHHYPDPDLFIRTSGEIRLSNFMLWQMAYSEFVFTDVLWPDFSKKDFLEAIDVYQARKRRYGSL